MPLRREGWLWQCFCKTAAERPLSASNYKFIFCKGTFWHNVQRKDIKCNLSANETKKLMRRRERQHILLKYVDMPLRSQCVPPPDTKGWNVLISTDNIYIEKTSNISFKVPKTPIILSPEVRGLVESPLQGWWTGNSLWTISPALLASSTQLSTSRRQLGTMENEFTFYSKRINKIPQQEGPLQPASLVG